MEGEHAVKGVHTNVTLKRRRTQPVRVPTTGAHD